VDLKCVVVSCGSIAVSVVGVAALITASSLALLATGFIVVVGDAIVASSSSSRGIVGVGVVVGGLWSSSVLRIVGSGKGR